jgi:hypothetical protein
MVADAAGKGTWTDPTTLEDEDWLYNAGGGVWGDIYHLGKIAVGGLSSPDGHAINVQNYSTNKSTVRAVTDLVGTIQAEGHLAVLSPTGLPISVSHIGVYGEKPNNGGGGAGVYGYNYDDNAVNYGGVFVANGTGGTNNVGVYGSASGGTNNYAAFFDGFVETTSSIDIGGNAVVDGSLQVGGGTVHNEIQSGTATIGGNPGSGVLVSTITFPNSFSSTPKVLCTVRTQTGASYTDVFAVTTKQISTTQFVVNIYRLDSPGGGWGQVLLLDWVVMN